MAYEEMAYSSHIEKTKSANTKHEFYVKFPHTGKS